MDKRVFELYQPITGRAGTAITQVSAGLVTLGQWIKNSAIEDDGDKQDAEVMSITGLNQSELDQLRSPDWLALHQFYEAQETMVSAEFMRQEGVPLGLKKTEAADGDAVDASPVDDDRFDLLVPITANGGESVASVYLSAPTIKQVRLRDKLTGDRVARAKFLTSACSATESGSSVGPDDFDALVMPDWLALQVRMGEFLGKPAGFFRKET